MENRSSHNGQENASSHKSAVEIIHENFTPEEVARIKQHPKFSELGKEDLIVFGGMASGTEMASVETILDRLETRARIEKVLTDSEQHLIDKTYE